MASTSSKTVKDQGSDEDLLNSLGKDGGNEGDFVDPDDLLNSIEEDDSEGWVPTEKGEGIVGTVIKVGVTRSDFASDGEDPNVPTITIETKDGDKFRIIGYGSVLKRELVDADPQKGDTLAVKYWGEKPIKKGKFAGRPYKHYSVAIRRAQAAVGK